MKKSKFITVLQSLDKKELKEFEHFLKSLYHRQETAISVFTYVLKIYPDYNSDKLDKDFVLKKLFKNNAIDPKARKNLDNVLSKLYRFLREYLLWKKMKTDHFEREKNLLEIFKTRKLEPLFLSTLETLTNEQNEKQLKDEWDHYNLLKFNHDYFYRSNIQKIKMDIDSLEAAMENLDLFYMTSKLKLACEMKNRENILKEKYSINLLEEITQYCQDNSLQTTDLQKAYLLLLQLFTKKEKRIFHQLKNNILTEKYELNNEGISVIVTYLINFASIKIKQGNASFYQEALQLYQYGLGSKIFLEDGYITDSKFNNIVSIACKLQHFEWTENFIVKWQKFLPDPMKETVVNISYAILFFEQKQFQKAIEVLNFVKFQNSFYALRTKSLILRSYYELYKDDNEDLILDYCKAFSHFLKRNKTIGMNTVKSYSSFIKMTQLLTKNNLPQNKLSETLHDFEFIIFKTWLSDKIEKLQASVK